MKKITSLVCLGAISLLPLSAWATAAAVKTACFAGDLGCIGIQLSDAAMALGDTNQKPISIACDETSLSGYWTQFACGSATCYHRDDNTNGPGVADYCADGPGNDGIVITSDRVFPWNDNPNRYRVECSGNCNEVRLDQICRGTQVPISVACDDTAVGNGTDFSCGTATCRQWGTLLGSDPLGAYCENTDGVDAIVTCTNPDSARGAVKVECWGSECNNVNLGQICDGVGLTNPVNISCDETATPGSGQVLTRCGWTENGATCTPWGNMERSDPLGAYCGDTGGYDAVVTCQ